MFERRPGERVRIGRVTAIVRFRGERPLIRPPHVVEPAAETSHSGPQPELAGGPRRRGLAGVVAVCLVLAGVSLVLLPRSVAYDPWSWLIWGREILHLDLDTRAAATAVKPLPIALDTIFALTGSAAAPVLWLLVARAATLLSLVLAFRVARRLAGIGAGVIAVIALAISDEYLGYLFMRGMSEPFAAAGVLAAVDSLLSRRRRAALGWLVVAGLLRPEAWPFLFGYCVWSARSGPLWRRSSALALAVIVPASWFVIDLFGAHQLSRSAGAAQHTSQGGPLLTRNPGIATVRETWHLMSGPVLVLFLAASAWAIVTSLRGRRLTPSAWLCAGAFGWLVIDAVLAQGRFATGAPRYLLPGVGLAVVAVGVFVADLVRAVVRRRPSPSLPVVVSAVTAVALVALVAPRLHTTQRQVRAGISIGRDFARLQSTLGPAITLAGGRDEIRQCGHVTTQPFQVPLVAWELHDHLENVGIVAAPRGTVFQEGGAPRLPAAVAAAYRLRGSVGTPGARWTVLSTCPAQPAGGAAAGKRATVYFSKAPWGASSSSGRPRATVNEVTRDVHAPASVG